MSALRISATGSGPVLADRLRQVAVSLTYVACIAANLVGAGVVGDREVSTADNAAFAADSSLLTPAGPAFSIWSLVYLGLAAYVVVQWLPSRAAATRHRAIGWLVVAASALNALWLQVTLDGYLWTSVPVIVLLLVVLAEIVRRLTQHPAEDRLDRLVTDGSFGLYVGWVSLAVVANVAAATTAAGAAATGRNATVVAVVVLVVIAGATALMARTWGGRLAVAAAQTWGLAWVAYGRLAGEPPSAVVGLVAMAAALVPPVAAGLVRRRTR
ncbi:MAG TPA: hypothetical protein VGE77_04565 [Nocardioides sp.]